MKRKDNLQALRIHNLAENTVLEHVEDLFEKEDGLKNKNFCSCYQCKMDVACYVLNRIVPEYTISGKGFAHLKSNYRRSFQKMADIDSLINEGIRKIAHKKRPHFKHESEDPGERPEGSFYNFPVILGRIFNGNNFEPVNNTEVSLLIDNEPVSMIDPNWQNPVKLNKSNAGIYQFWPAPVKAPHEGLTKTWTMGISVNDTEYDELKHFFELEVESAHEYIDYFQSTKSCEIKDLYVFPSGSG